MRTRRKNVKKRGRLGQVQGAGVMELCEILEL